MKIRIIHTPLSNHMEPYVVAEVETNLTEGEAEHLIREEWSEFQSSHPDTDSMFANWLVETGLFTAIKSDFVDINV